MNWFKRKKHTKDSYEKAEKELKVRKKWLEEAEENYKKINPFRPIKNPFVDLSGVYLALDSHQRYYSRAKAELDKLYAKGHDEGHKLNKKYDELVVERDKLRDKWGDMRFGKTGTRKELESAYHKFQTIKNKLYDFETKELGMHKWEKIKKNISTLTGIISVASFILAALLVTDITGDAIGSVVGTKNPFFLIMGFIFGIIWLILRR